MTRFKIAQKKTKNSLKMKETKVKDRTIIKILKQIRK